MDGPPSSAAHAAAAAACWRSNAAWLRLSYGRRSCQPAAAADPPAPQCAWLLLCWAFCWDVLALLLPLLWLALVLLLLVLEARLVCFLGFSAGARRLAGQGWQCRTE